MKRWLVAIIIGNLGRIFNNPTLFQNLENRLADSKPVRQFARTIVNVLERGSWQMKRLSFQGLKEIEPGKIKQTEENLARRFKELTEDWARKAREQQQQRPKNSR